MAGQAHPEGSALCGLSGWQMCKQHAARPTLSTTKPSAARVECATYLNLWHIQEPSAAADEGASWERQLGDCLESALVQDARPVL